MKIIAHRGASAERPENTLKAFERALEIGVDGIEADILLTRDGKLVARHDDLISYKKKWQYVRDLNYAQLREIDVGEGERIPLLDEVFDRFSGRCPMVLDIKAHGIAKPLAAFLASKRAEGKAHVTSFLHSEVAMVRSEYPSADCSIVLADMPVHFREILKYASVNEVSLFRGYLTEKAVSTLREHEVTVRAFPVNHVWEAKLFSSWGVEAVFTDDPSSLKRGLA